MPSQICCCRSGQLIGITHVDIALLFLVEGKPNKSTTTTSSQTQRTTSAVPNEGRVIKYLRPQPARSLDS